MPLATKELQREYQRIWVANRRAEFFNGKFCIKCGSKDDLNLHHTNPEDKISHSIWSWKKDRREEEIRKCEILCGNCHRRHHAELRMKNYHGIISMYKRGCRCDECKNANKLYKREYRARLKISN